MAFTNVIRRAVSSTIGATGSQRHYHHKSMSTLFSNSAPLTRTAALSQNLFRISLSTETTQSCFLRFLSFVPERTTRQVCDAAVVKVIDSLIEDEIVEVPKNFPFKIQEEPKKQNMILKFEDYDENFTVTIHMPSMLSLSKLSPTCMGVRTSNQRLAALLFEYGDLDFDVYAYPDKIEIRSMAIVVKDKTTGRRYNFGELDENLQKAFYKYLDSRGINLHLTNFLHEYIKKKDKFNKEYLEWLKNLRKCVTC